MFGMLGKAASGLASQFGSKPKNTGGNGLMGEMIKRATGGAIGTPNEAQNVISGGAGVVDSSTSDRGPSGWWKATLGNGLPPGLSKPRNTQAANQGNLPSPWGSGGVMTPPIAGPIDGGYDNESPNSQPDQYGDLIRRLLSGGNYQNWM